MNSLIKSFLSKENEKNSKKKIENLIFLIIILCITLFLMKNIWNNPEQKFKEEKNEDTKILAQENSNKEDLEKELEQILSTIKNVGNTKVFVNYLETRTIVPIYDETSTTSTIDEGDSSGGIRNTVQTETQKKVIFSEESGSKEPAVSKEMMPVIQGVIVTAEGAADATTKTNIINAVQAATGLSIDRIQVFEMKNRE